MACLAGPASADLRFVAVGNPNTGKTTLVNALSGSCLRIGNWPGTTVERVETCFAVGDRQACLVDLPGAYSLAAGTAEERLTRDELLAARPDAVVDVVDASNLERNLYLTLELAELGYPLVVALNLLDEAQARGLDLRVEVLEERLGVPVVATVAVREQGMEGLISAALQARPATLRLDYPESIESAVTRLEPLISHPSRRWMALAALSGEPISLDESASRLLEILKAELASLGVDPFLAIVGTRYQTAREIAASVQATRPGAHRLTEALDRWFLHPWLGIPLFLLGMLLVFRFTFQLSEPWVGWLGLVQEVLGGWITAMPLPELVASFLADGLIGGIGTVLAFTPVLFFLFLALSFLEASGFLARSAFLVDRLMKVLGLPGRAFIPMILGFGCNVPAISATRTMESFSDRLRVAMAVPFAACSARLVVFTLFTSVFFPGHAALVVFGLYLLGLLVGMLTALALSRLTPPSEEGSAMELPPYRIPTWKVVWRQASARTWIFLEGVGGAILLSVAAVWVLLNLPPGDISQSLYARLSMGLAWFLGPLEIHDWRLAGALVPGFVAKEVVIGTLGVSYLQADPVAPMGFLEGLRQIASGFLGALWATLQAIPAMLGLPGLGLPPHEAPEGLPAALSQSMSRSGALAYLVFVLLYTPCVGTLMALRLEFGRRWATLSALYQLVVAYALAFLAARLPL
ncbi:MAG: ferrous iron transport protein B [Candidatus Xenobium sp.]|nr:ferrous iron transport protein B [Burkholderiales bacterium]